MQQTKLKNYFPMLNPREELMEIINKNEELTKTFNSWKPERREEFLDFCSGARGVKMLYDTFAKELLSPKRYPDRLNAWFLFLGSDDPEDVIRLIETHPDFEAMYRQIYEICENVENVMGLFSKELERIDRNTAKYMMDEMQEEIDRQKNLLAEKDNALAEKDTTIAQKDAANAQKDEENRRLRELLALANIQI